MRAEPAEATQPPVSLAERIVVAVTLLVALALRLYRLGYSQFWFDELGQAVAGIGPLRHTLEEAARHLGAAPLDYLIVRVMLNVGNDEAILRLPAVLWNVLTIYLLYRFTRTLSGPLPAIVAAALVALMPLHISYSQELRFYSLGTFTALCTVALFWRAQGHGGTQRGGMWAWVAYALMLGLALHAHYYQMFVAIALGLWTLIYRRERFRAMFVATSAGALLFLPWAVYDNVIINPRRPNVNPLAWSMPVDLPTLATSAVTSLPTGPQWFGLQVPHGTSYEDVWLPLFVGLLWAGAILAAWIGIRTRRAEFVLPPLLVAVTTVGLLMLDIVGNYYFLPRQMMIGSLYLYMAAAVALFEVARRPTVWRMAGPALAALVVLGSALVLRPNIEHLYIVKEPLATLRNIGMILYQNARPGDAVIVGGPLDQYRFYVPDLAAPATEVPRGRVAERVAEQQPSSGRLWLVLWYGIPAFELRAWAEENGAWDLTPWLNGLGAPAPWDDELPRVYLYSAAQPDAGLEAGCQLRLSPFVEQHGRAYLLQSLADQLRARERAAEAELLESQGRLSPQGELCIGAEGSN